MRNELLHKIVTLDINFENWTIAFLLFHMNRKKCLKKSRVAVLSRAHYTGSCYCLLSKLDDCVVKQGIPRNFFPLLRHAVFLLLFMAVS